MRKHRKSTTKLLLATMILTATMGVTTYAAEWKQDTTGWWYEQDGGGYATGWQWIDGKCYYFDTNGYMAANTEIDGYSLNASGEWTVDGVVQTQGTDAATNTGATNNEIAAAVARAKAAGAGSYQDQYISGGWKTAESVDYEIRATKDTDGMIVSPTSGIVGRTEGVYDYPSAGSDKSISLATDPSNGILQPNWIYNPLGKQMVAPPIICMDKNVYDSIGWQQTNQDLNTGIFSYRMDTCDTSGSWVYNPNPSGSSDYFGRGGQLSGWMYRYADGSYAANGDVYIYDFLDTTGYGDGNVPSVHGKAYEFNENGFLVTNSAHDSTYLDEYGRVCDGTAGPFGQGWKYTK